MRQGLKHLNLKHLKHKLIKHCLHCPVAACLLQIKGTPAPTADALLHCMPEQTRAKS